MVVVKLLARKGIIRFFGVALVLAPFFNILMSMSLQTQLANPWTWKVFWKIISTSSAFDHVLYIASLSIGLIMLRGALTAWKWVLFLLGGVIANQTANLGSSFRANWMSIPFFIINVSTFLFILDQLVWKQKKAQAPKIEFPTVPKTVPKNDSPILQSSPPSPSPSPSPPQPLPQPVQPRPIKLQATQKRVLISFAGVGPWAQLIAISKNGMHVRSIQQPPAELHFRKIEITLQNGLSLQLRLNHQSGENFYFDYLNLTTNDVRMLNQWLQHQAA